MGRSRLCLAVLLLFDRKEAAFGLSRSRAHAHRLTTFLGFRNLYNALHSLHSHSYIVCTTHRAIVQTSNTYQNA